MIDERRVRIETQMSLYRQNKGKADERVNHYFKSDYIGSQLLHTFVSTTIAYAVILFVLAFYHFEDLMLMIYSENLASFVVLLITIYVLLLVLFMTITWFVYAARYKRARRHLNQYYQDLHYLLDRTVGKTTGKKKTIDHEYTS